MGLAERGADFSRVEVVAYAVPGNQGAINVVAKVGVTDDLVDGFAGSEEEVVAVWGRDVVEQPDALRGFGYAGQRCDEDVVVAPCREGDAVGRPRLGIVAGISLALSVAPAPGCSARPRNIQLLVRLHRHGHV
jgi:hypothetical protein